MRRFTRRTMLVAVGAAGGYVTARTLSPALPGLEGVPVDMPGGAGTLNDASLLSQTPVAAHLMPSPMGRDEAVAFLRSELRIARDDRQSLCVSAARHSMGGHAIPNAGRAITLAHAPIEIDTAAGSYRVGGGSRWLDTIAELDPVGLSPAVMQSNNDFGVAATVSVNAHGWAAPRGPMGSTVRSIDLMLADGEIVSCSRELEPNLFRAAIGGYGLVGIIIGMEVGAAPNRLLEPQFEAMPADEFGRRFAKTMDQDGVDMAYGRLSIDRRGFFDDALLVTYRPAEDQSELDAASGSTWSSHAAARLYRWQLGSERWKRWRWTIERDVNPHLAAAGTRNSLINEPVATLDDRDPRRTDILHEYFVAPERFAEFLDLCRKVIPASYQEMLNITLRWVAADTSSMLNYCPTDRIAGVMSFSQEMTLRAEADMARMTRELIDGVHDLGGAYYLPYRPHATMAQFKAGYPEAAAFAALKREVDPTLILRNKFWDNFAGRA